MESICHTQQENYSLKLVEAQIACNILQKNPHGCRYYSFYNYSQISGRMSLSFEVKRAFLLFKLFVAPVQLYESEFTSDNGTLQ